MLREGNLSKSKLGDVLQITARNVIFCFCGKYRARGGGTSGKLGDLSQITARNWKRFLSGNPTRTKISFRSNPIFSEDELFIFVISSAAKAFFNFHHSNNHFRPPPLAHYFYKYGPHHQYPCHRCCRHQSRHLSHRKRTCWAARWCRSSFNQEIEKNRTQPLSIYFWSKLHASNICFINRIEYIYKRWDSEQKCCGGIKVYTPAALALTAPRGKLGPEFLSYFFF